MISLSHLAKLHGVGRIRKCSLILEEAQRRWPGSAGQMRPLRSMAVFLAETDESSFELRRAARDFLEASDLPDGELRALDRFRHALRTISGQSSADWDLLDPADFRASNHLAREPTGRSLYLEDLRSPFNVGTVFRTAEAFGFDEILLSPDCADPLHPRALRSSMGTVERIPWRRIAPEELPSSGLLALELGGTTLDKFVFPKKGILILGSEELGVSAPLLALAGEARISIPMRGYKASLNVAVAFGITANAWATQVENSSRGTLTGAAKRGRIEKLT
ncbi:MAG: TrmH family RNA methyltransferase [Spirochaetes bacterium]|nr:MAG: TrmH family RNA methyltransferase [Spirochaetota bacterium]